MDDTGFDSINVIPLVDVMLVLLTIVLTTSTFIAVGSIPVTLPTTKGDIHEQLKPAAIEIDQSGSLFYNGKAISLSNMENRLSEIDRDNPVVIRADKNIALQIFVDVMDVVQGLGFRKVSLQTKVQK